jgi:hypothetical protein
MLYYGQYNVQKKKDGKRLSRSGNSENGQYNGQKKKDGKRTMVD